MPSGQPIFTHQPQIRQAIAPDLAAQMVHLLRQTVDRGTGHQVRTLRLCAANRWQDRHDQRQYRRLVYWFHAGLNRQCLGGIRRPPHP